MLSEDHSLIVPGNSIRRGLTCESIPRQFAFQNVISFLIKLTLNIILFRPKSRDNLVVSAVLSIDVFCGRELNGKIDIVSDFIL